MRTGTEQNDDLADAVLHDTNTDHCGDWVDGGGGGGFFLACEDLGRMFDQ